MRDLPFPTNLKGFIKRLFRIGTSHISWRACVMPLIGMHGIKYDYLHFGVYFV